MKSPLARLDWRFLVTLGERTNAGTILLQGGPDDAMDRARRADLGGRIVTRLESATRLDGAALLLGSTLNAPDVAPHLKSGGFLWQELRVSGLPRLLEPAVDRRLEVDGAFRVTARFAVWPDFESAEFYVPIDSPESVGWFLRTEYPGWTFGDRSRRSVLRLLSRARRSGRAPFTKYFGISAIKGDPPEPAGEGIEAWRAAFVSACPGGARTLRPILTGHGHARAVILGVGPGERRPGLVAKLSRRPEFAPVNRAEQERLSEVRRAVDEQTRMAIPDPLGCVEMDGRTAALERHVPGTSMVRVDGSRGVSRAVRARHLRLACEWLGRFQRQATVARTPWSADHIDSWVREPSRAHRSELGSTPRRQRFFRSMRRRAEALQGLPFPTVWCHGDFTPWNLRLAGSRLYVTDWEGAHPGPALRDLVHLITHWNELAQGARTTLEKTNALRRLLDGEAPRWIGRCVRSVLRRYLAALDLDEGFVGLFVCVTWVELAVRQTRAAHATAAGESAAAANPALELVNVLMERRNVLLRDN